MADALSCKFIGNLAYIAKVRRPLIGEIHGLKVNGVRDWRTLITISSIGVSLIVIRMYLSYISAKSLVMQYSKES